jgi:hypothetical protein
LAWDFPQALGMAQLAEQHGDQLGPTAEAARVALGLMFLHSASNCRRGINCKI